MHNQIILSKNEFLEMIRNLAEFPFGKICKHSVACSLLNIMEQKGIDFDDDMNNLVKASVESDDETMIQLCNKLISKETI